MNTSWPVMVVLVCIFIMFYMTYELMIKIARKLGVYNPSEWRMMTIVKNFQGDIWLWKYNRCKKHLKKVEKEFEEEMGRGPF